MIDSIGSFISRTFINLGWLVVCAYFIYEEKNVHLVQLGCVLVSRVQQNLIFSRNQAHWCVITGHRSAVNIVALALKSDYSFTCFAGRIIALSEGTAASVLLHCHCRMLFCFETAWKYGFLVSTIWTIIGWHFLNNLNNMLLMPDGSNDDVHHQLGVASKPWRI